MSKGAAMLYALSIATGAIGLIPLAIATTLVGSGAFFTVGGTLGCCV